MFPTKLFGYDKKQVDIAIHDCIVYIKNLKEDIDFLRREYVELRSKVEFLQRDNEHYVSAIKQATKQTEDIITEIKSKEH